MFASVSRRQFVGGLPLLRDIQLLKIKFTFQTKSADERRSMSAPSVSVCRTHAAVSSSAFCVLVSFFVVDLLCRERAPLSWRTWRLMMFR